MSIEFQHILTGLVFAGYVIAGVILNVICLSRAVDMTLSSKTSKKAAGVLLIFTVATAAAFFFTYGAYVHEKIHETIDNNGDLRFTVSHDGIDIWARRK